MQRYRLAFVSNSAEIAEAVNGCSDRGTEDIVCRLATLEDAVRVARRLLDDGVEVILGCGATGGLLAQEIGQPVVKIPRTYLDILRALLQAGRSGRRVGVTSFAEATEGLEILGKVLDLDIHQIVFTNMDELREGIRRGLASGVSCVVGSGICRDVAVEEGGTGIVAIPSRNVILQALREARALAAARRAEQREQEQLHTILEIMKEGVIVIDRDLRTRVFNQMAADTLGITADGATAGLPGELIERLGLLSVLHSGKAEIEQVRRTEKATVVISTLPISVNGRTEGVVATFKPVARIQTMDRRIRERLYAKGFVARHTVESIKSRDPGMLGVIEKARQYAKADAGVLIEGESGTGKEMLAQGIHNLSDRRGKPFVAINCAALPETLLESELFGYEEGAFTGAKKGGKIGFFELANGGTLFLDEITDVPISLQVRLLRVLEEREIMRVGGDRIVQTNVRIIASTHCNLYERVQERRFRNDLYFRLSTLMVRLPPLRERAGDLSLIVDELLDRHGNGAKKVSERMLEPLRAYHWPGNIRELDSLIRRYVILLGEKTADDGLFRALFAELRGCVEATAAAAVPKFAVEALNEGERLRDRIEDFESRVIEATLARFRFNRAETAKRLGISVNTLWRKLPKKHAH